MEPQQDWTTPPGDELVLYGQHFQSRLLMGTALYPSPEIMRDASHASGATIVTAGLRLKSAESGGAASCLDYIRSLGRTLLSNATGCHTMRASCNLALFIRYICETIWA